MKESSVKNISFDFGLLFIYQLAMMALFGARFIKSARNEALFAAFLGTMLAIISIIHRVRNRWEWPGLDKLSFPSAVLGVFAVYLFFAFTAYALTGHKPPDLYNANYPGLIKDSWFLLLKVASIPQMTPWYLAGIGIGVFNLLSSLKFVTAKKQNFENQCING